MRRAWGKLSKVLLFVWVSSKLNFPPNTCMPSREKMMMKRKSSRSREAMDFMELSSDATRLLRDCQCLNRRSTKREEDGRDFNRTPQARDCEHTSTNAQHVDSLTVWPWKSSPGARSGTQRYRVETWFPAPPEWFQWFLRTQQSSQSGWRVTQNKPAAQDCTSLPTFHMWTGPAAPCWPHLKSRGKDIKSDE